VSDAEDFDFTSNSPVTVGWGGTAPDPQSDVLPAIERGAEQLQRLVDAFDRLGLEKVEPGEFASLIVDPRELFDRKVQEAAGLLDTDRAAFLRSMESVDFEAVREVEADLMDNPYMLHQVMNFMDTAPLLRIFSLVDGKVMIDRSAANVFADRERLHPLGAQPVPDRGSVRLGRVTLHERWREDRDQPKSGSVCHVELVRDGPVPQLDRLP
jgi:hypothetical protein